MRTLSAGRALVKRNCRAGKSGGAGGSEARTGDPAAPGAALDVLRPCDHPLAGRGWAVTATKLGNGLIKNMPVKSSSVQGYSG